MEIRIKKLTDKLLFWSSVDVCIEHAVEMSDELHQKVDVYVDNDKLCTVYGNDVLWNTSVVSKSSDYREIMEKITG